MKTVLIALLLSSVAIADPAPPPACTPVKKVNKAWTAKCHGVSITKRPDGTCDVKEPAQPACPEPTVVEKRVEVQVPAECPEVPACPQGAALVESPAPARLVASENTTVFWRERKPFLLVGPRAALDMNATGPSLAGLVGLRLHVPSWHVGLDGYTQFNHGSGVQALGYVYQGVQLNAHVDLGVAFDSRLLAVPDVPRSWDFTTGGGVEVPVWGPISFTADLKFNVTNPWYIASHDHPVMQGGKEVYGPAGKYLDVKHVLGNTFLEPQLLIGVMVNGGIF